MKKLFSMIFAVALMAYATAGSAWWNDDDYYGGGPWGHDWNPYDEWDPRYWMEEMEDIWDDDDVYWRYGGYGPYGGYGYGPYGGGGYPYGGGYYGAPYGGGYYQQPYGGGYYQQPYGGYGY